MADEDELLEEPAAVPARLEHKVYFTDREGFVAMIVGMPPAVEALTEILKRAGVEYDEQADSWHDGYYAEAD